MVKKKYELKILAPAREEIIEIARIYKGLVGSNSAEKITNSIKKSLEHLRSHPDMGMALEDKELYLQGYRKLICGNYLCFYRLIDEVVFVYHIVDGRTEYKHIFNRLHLND